MLFHVIAAVASVAFTAQGILAQQQTVQDIVNNINEVFQIAENTRISLLVTIRSTNQAQTSAQVS